MTDFSDTTLLLQKFRAGDMGSSDQLFRLYQPRLLKWAHGRIPNQARGLMDTEDLVQDTLLMAFKSAENIKTQYPAAFFVYLRTILLNQIKLELRKNKPLQQSITQFSDHEKMTYQQDLDALNDYDLALSQLNPEEKQAIILRMEFAFSYPEIAQFLEKPSGNAARMFISRTLIKLAELMK